MAFVVCAVGITVGGISGVVAWLLCSARSQAKMQLLQTDLHIAQGASWVAESRFRETQRAEVGLRHQMHRQDDEIADLQAKLARFQRRRGAGGRFEAKADAGPS